MASMKFGCEFEFSNDPDYIYSELKKSLKKQKKLQRAKQSNYEYTRNNTSWIVKDEESTRAEICSPVSTKQDIKHISQVIANLDAKITKNDGFHIHMSSSNIPREQIVVAWLMIEPIISKCFPRSRQNNIFCRAIWKAFQNKTHPIYTYIDRALTRMNNHYVAFSLEDMNRVRNTVEFRLPESTTDPVMIQNCIKFVYAFMKYAKIVKPTTHGHKKITSIRGVGSMVKVMDIKDQDLVKWLVQRHKQHKDATLTKAEQKNKKKK